MAHEPLSLQRQHSPAHLNSMIARTVDCKLERPRFPHLGRDSEIADLHPVIVPLTPKPLISTSSPNNFTLILNFSPSSNHSPSSPLKLSLTGPKLSSTESAFDIPSGDFQEIESPFEYPHLNDILSSPHDPPFEPVKDPCVRSELKSQVSLFLGPFQNYMEERLIRWGPSDSQFGNQASIDGCHPYQTNISFQETEHSIFRTFKNWLASPEPE